MNFSIQSPYLCYENGGGKFFEKIYLKDDCENSFSYLRFFKAAFLIPFVIFLFLIGIPVMFLEFSVGQFMSRGPVKSWVMVPIFKGIKSD